MTLLRKTKYALMAICFISLLATTSVFAAVTSNELGTHGGYDYEFWKDSGGSGSMTLGNGGTFSAEWSNVNNILFRKGQRFDETRTHQQIGDISIDYGVNYQPNGNSYLTVYGWSVDPLVEYYIVDSWGTWRPPGANSKGTVQVDGGTYDIYETTRVNQPSIRGTQTFQQYWSVRRDKRTSGTISVSEHFRAWEQHGMPLGNLYEAALTIEGYQSSGQANVYRNVLSINESGSGGSSGSGPTRVEAESMTLGGPYASRSYHPFDGVTLYANGDSASYTQYFANDTHTFSLRGASDGPNLASVDLMIGGEYKGTFYYGDEHPATYTIENVRHGTGHQEIELIVTSDNDTWDIHLDYLEIH
ncbi:endo-1,4-beta-xylanase [Pelagirhabdus alkalitolerans]|uniref:Endo-1,4-beta-xylanase n=1 Tax=Pelagirhabdus alkalitolerans TaxID=1612202 RepID=A0A1G6K8S0_9BACI|nr:glycoside hydrolase family 11 protein [Pelagirhabdus alkalitolerans]SDC27462.1 endo-1,4-beta-xylanase [Pelagirhabdus alkalitolerans]